MLGIQTSQKRPFASGSAKVKQCFLEAGPIELYTCYKNHKSTESSSALSVCKTLLWVCLGGFSRIINWGGDATLNVGDIISRSWVLEWLKREKGVRQLSSGIVMFLLPDLHYGPSHFPSKMDCSSLAVSYKQSSLLWVFYNEYTCLSKKLWTSTEIERKERKKKS